MQSDRDAMSQSNAMNPDDQHVWLDKYPRLFLELKGEGAPRRPQFDFGRGWNGIVDSLLWCIEWTMVVDFDLREQSVLIRSIREYRGTLEVDFAFEAPWATALVRLSNARAEETCEVCGQPGQWSNAGWPQVRCARHRRPLRSDYVDGTHGAGLRNASVTGPRIGGTRRMLSR